MYLASDANKKLKLKYYVIVGNYRTEQITQCGQLYLLTVGVKTYNP